MHKLHIIIETKNKKPMLFKIIALVFVILFLECVVFQYRSLESMKFQTLSWEDLQKKGVTFNKGLTENENGDYVLDAHSSAIELNHLNLHVENIYLDIERRNEAQESEPITVELEVVDEAHSLYFSLPERTILANQIERSRYIRLHLSGLSEKLRITVNGEAGDTIHINEIALNHPVPYRINPIRLVIMAVIGLFLFLLYPASPLYQVSLFDSDDGKHTSTGLISAVIVLQLILFGTLCFANKTYVNPPWEHHYQYQKLAVSLSKGQLYLEDEVPQTLLDMENPYDTSLRRQLLQEAGESILWDTAYYNGHYYVYFGIVPELCFYLPYYLLTHQQFKTVYGILICGWICTIAIFWMMKQLCRRFFPAVSLGQYLILSLLLLYGSAVVTIFLQPSFYALPIIMAMMFTFLGLGCWLNASWRIEQGKTGVCSLFLGSLCMALVAGCRPQFLLGSLLAFALFGAYIRGFVDKNARIPKFIPHLAAVCLPYLLIMLALFWYNTARFGSPFDFGANYNLTTNDMTRRAFVWERLPLGLWRYLFQPPGMEFAFPFITASSSNNSYMGQTIQEAMFGGVFICNIFCWILLSAKTYQQQLKKQGIWGIFGICIVSAVIIVCADTQMAGLLERYKADFSWMLFLAGILLALTLLGKAETREKIRLHKFIYISWIGTTAYQVLAGIANAGGWDSWKYMVEFWL